MPRVNLYMKSEDLEKIDAQRGNTPRSKAIRICLTYLLDQNYLHNVIPTQQSDQP